MIKKNTENKFKHSEVDDPNPKNFYLKIFSRLIADIQEYAIENPQKLEQRYNSQVAKVKSAKIGKFWLI
jgi:uncharacterized protein YaaN involved in tellurite resistance